MGCFCSSGFSEYSHIYRENPQLASWLKEFRALALSDQAVHKFWQIFKKIDMDGSGSIEIQEMLVHFDIERTKFTKRVFGIFDEDGSGEIDLREFILALWNYCTLGKATLVIFAFDLYDKDGSGIIDSTELGQMLKEVYGSNYETNTYAKRIVDSIRGMMSDSVDIDSFRKFVKKHPALLFPAFEVQRKMQDHTMGQRYWSNLANKRLKTSSGAYVPIKKYMELHLEELVREDKAAVEKAAETAMEAKERSKAGTGTGPRRNSRERRGSTDFLGTQQLHLHAKEPAEQARRNTRERRKSRDAASQLVEQKEPGDHVKDAMAAMAAASTVPHPLPPSKPDQNLLNGRDAVDNHALNGGHSSVKADRKDALRRKTIDAFDQRANLLANTNINSGTGSRTPPVSTATFKSVEKITARQRRKSTMNAQLPSQSGENDSAPDIYDALLALSKDIGDNKSNDKKKKKFEKLVAKHAAINPE